MAARLRERNPGLPVVFTSGYAADVMGKDLVLEPGQVFLQKPSAWEQIFATVRQCLDARPLAGRAGGR